LNIAIIGAGALGRGLLYPLCVEQGHDVDLVDLEKSLAREWEAVWVGTNTYTQRYMTPTLDRVVGPKDLVFTCVPPGAIPQAVSKLAVDVKTPIVCLENIKNPAAMYKKYLPFHNLINGIAWVSAYREAWSDRYFSDAGRIETEYKIPLDHPRLTVMESYEGAYEMKLLLHNAPHAVIAYCGWALGARTIPEAFDRLRTDYDDLFQALTYLYPGCSVQIAREYARFSDDRFPDLVDRVARCPSRKLMRGERLPALYRALENYPRPQRLVRRAIDCAIDYGEQHDGQIGLWLQQNGRASLIEHYCGLGGE